MKKQLCMVLATTVITTLSLPAVAFADTTASTSNNTSTSAITAPAVIVKDMTFTSPTVKLSLNDTYKKLETSTSMELINIKKKIDNSTAQGYMEKVSRLNKAEQSSDNPSSPHFWTYDSSNKKMAIAMKNFAASMLEPNNTARINKLKRDTFEQYYTLKNLENQIFIAKDNLQIANNLLKNAQLKFKLGTISKMDVLTAEINVKTAQDNYKAAQDALNSLKMSFNVNMGYPLMQDISLTDEIKEVSLPTTNLETAIKSALANRTEIKEAAYNLQMAQLTLDNVKSYPKSSSTYLDAQAGFISAELNQKNKPKDIEMDIRTKYMTMTTAYQKVQSGKQSVSNAKETSRLAQLQYDSGMTTLTTVQQANLSYYNAQLEQSKALLDYNLAVEDFNLAQGIGINSATIVSGSN